MSDALNEEILQLLSAYSEPLTTSFISFNLAGYSFSEVCGALSDLQGAGLVSLDSFGYQLVEQEPPTALDEPQLVPDQPNEQLAELSAENTTPTPEPSEAHASEAEAVSATEEPLAHEDSFPPISFDIGKKFQLDERLAELLAGAPYEENEEAPVGSDAPVAANETEQSPEPEQETLQQVVTEAPYSDEPMIGDARTGSSIDEEFRMMLEEFASGSASVSTQASSTPSSSQSTTEADEYRALLERLIDASSDSEDTAATPRTIKDEELKPSAQGPVLTYDMPVSVFGFSTRTTNVLANRSIGTVEELVRNLSSLGEATGAGVKCVEEIDRGLKSHAIDLHIRLDEDQMSALRGSSGSYQYVFDVFGRLCNTQQGMTSDYSAMACPTPFTAMPDVSLDPSYADAPLEQFDLPGRLVRALSRIQVRTVGQAAKLSEEQLLSLRGVGALAVERLSELLRELSTANTSQLREADAVQEGFDQPSGGAIDNVPDTNQNAVLGARLALEICQDQGYPLFDQSFLICMPRAAEQSIGADCTAEAYRDAIIELVEGSDDLLDSCQRQLAIQVEQSKCLNDDVSFIEEIPVPPYALWQRAARKLAEEDGWCLYDAERHAIRINHPHLIDWVETANLDDKTRTILRRFLAGDTLQAIGDSVDLTRERVRQITTRELKSAPAVEENRYRYFFETYQVTKQDFLEITSEPVGTYLYLRTTKSRATSGDSPYTTKALKDERIPQTARDGIRRIMDSGYIYADGYRILKSRDAIITHLVMRHATQQPIRLERLMELYEEFLQSHDLGNNKHFQFTGTRAFEAFIGRCDQVMNLPHNTATKFEGSIRYYDASSMDFEPLSRLLASRKHDDIECSTVLLMDDEGFAEVLDELDIHNGYELHYVIRHYCPEIEGVTMLRSPNIMFGNGSRNDQVLALIKELSPVTAQDLAAAYAARYGVDQATFMGSYLTPFRIYFKNGKYLYTSERLTSEQREFILAQLDGSENYMSLTLLRARFKDRFPDASTSLVNEENLAELGYHPSTGLLVRDGIDERELFGSLLDRQQRFSMDDEGFGKDVFDNPSFQAELSIRERSFSLVEFERDCYLSSNVFSALDEPISRDDLRDYVEQAIAFMAPDTPYTVKSLVSSGFTHKIDVLRDDFGLSDFFFSSLLRTGTVGGRLKITSVGEVAAFCKTRYSYSAPVMLEQIVNSITAIEVDDLRYLLSVTYGIEVTNALIRTYIKRSDLHFNEALDMVFDSPETYKRKAQEWIS